MIAFANPRVEVALPRQERAELSPLDRSTFPSGMESLPAFPDRYPPAVLLDADRRANLFLPAATSSSPLSAQSDRVEPFSNLGPDTRKVVEGIATLHDQSSGERRAIQSAFSMPEAGLLDSFQAAALANFLGAGSADWFNHASGNSKSRLLENFVDPSRDLNVAVGILEGRSFQQMTPDQKGKMLDLMVATSDPESFAALANRTIGPDKAPALLALDSRGSSMLDNMHRMLTTKTFADPELNGMRDELMSSAYKIFGDPNRITQGNRGTCGATSCEWDFLTRDPGETSRVLAEIVISGKAELRSKQQVLTLDPGSVEPDGNGRRGLADRLLQVSIMQYGAGSADYRNSDDLKHDGENLSAGMKPVRTNKLLSAFHGRTAVMSLMTEPDRSDPEFFMKGMKESVAIGPTLVSMQWGRDANDQKADAHAVAVTKIDDGRVYFRNPQGPTPWHRNGEDVRSDDAPPIRIENRLSGEQSMSEKDFTDRLKWAHEWSRHFK